MSQPQSANGIRPAVDLHVVSGELWRNQSDALMAADEDDERPFGPNADELPYDPGTDSEYGKEKRREQRRRYIHRELDREQLQAHWKPLPEQGSLEEQLESLAEDQEPYVVEGVFPENTICQINAQYKVGKTTMAVNLAGDLAENGAFLDKFAVNPSFAGNIAHWNLEVSRNMLVRWYAARGLSVEARKRLVPLHLRGDLSIDFNNPTAVKWTIQWLKDHDVSAWIIDPLSKLYRDNENSNTEFNTWWQKLEFIVAEANVKLVVILHHTGHNGERARGASAMMGNADVLFSYTHAGKLGEMPPNSTRYLEGKGRGVDELSTVEIDFDPATKRLSATANSKTKREAVKGQLAKDVGVAVWNSSSDLNKGELFGALGWSNGGEGYEEKQAAVSEAAACGYVVIEKSGRSTLHKKGKTDPRNMIQPRVKRPS